MDLLNDSSRLVLTLQTHYGLTSMDCRKSWGISERSHWFQGLSLSTSSRDDGISKSPTEEQGARKMNCCSRAASFCNRISPWTMKRKPKLRRGRKAKTGCFWGCHTMSLSVLLLVSWKARASSVDSTSSLI